MIRLRNAAFTGLGVFCLIATALPGQAAPRNTLVEVNGHKLNVRVAGTGGPGTPIVVFESGLGTPVEVWSDVQSAIARSARTIAYDRAGVGKSEPGKETPTVKYIVSELHALLAKLDAPPPYVLVGHSWGGPIIHTFAATFPKEVAGLV